VQSRRTRAEKIAACRKRLVRGEKSGEAGAFERWLPGVGPSRESGAVVPGQQKKTASAKGHMALRRIGGRRAL
jgi:hypothetical protein